MATLSPYITFGNTKEALDYYVAVFGATKVHHMAVGREQAALFGVSEEEAPNLTMHAQFDVLGATISGSDSFDKSPIVHKDNGIAIMLDVNSDDPEQTATADAFWEKVSSSGEVDVVMPYAKQFWGGMMGSFVDKYGIRWMLSAQSYSQIPQSV